MPELSCCWYPRRPPEMAPFYRASKISVPEFAALTPGEVGLYQINVKLPNTFPSVPACAFPIYSNLTINISDGNPINPSSDGAPICILPPS